jgi:hypothetical protein
MRIARSRVELEGLFYGRFGEQIQQEATLFMSSKRIP